MQLSDMDIDVPGIAEIAGALSRIARRAGELASRPIDHVAICVAAANLRRYTRCIQQCLPAARLREHEVGEPDGGMRIAELADSTTGIHIALAAPTGPKGQVAEFLARNGAEGLQHIAFGVPDLRSVMDALAADGLAFVGSAGNRDAGIIEAREGNRWVRQAFTERLFGEFFVELIERNGLEGLQLGNMQGLYALNARGRGELPEPA